jgi:Fur family transcriptional regulator, ferric uptake regulator
MSCIPRLTQLLHQRGFRMTPQRLAILPSLHDGGHLSPSQVYARVAWSGLTGPTVYRTLDFLVENGILLVANQSSGHLAYELAGGNHHHLACRLCGAQVELEPEAIEPLLDHLQQRTGYRLDGGHLSFRGLCPACQGKGEI